MLLPLFPLFNATGLEEFEWPNEKTWLVLSANAFMGTFISDYCWVRSCVLMGPLITTMALGLTIPLSMVASSFWDDVHFTWMYYLGSLLILIAFMGLSIYDYKKGQKEK